MNGSFFLFTIWTERGPSAKRLARFSQVEIIDTVGKLGVYHVLSAQVWDDDGALKNMTIVVQTLDTLTIGYLPEFEVGRARRRGNVTYVDFASRVLPVVDEYGKLTPHGTMICSDYALSWLAGHRDIDLEDAFPELAVNMFETIRSHEYFAKEQASFMPIADVIPFPGKIRHAAVTARKTPRR